MFQPVYTSPPSSASYFATRLRRCFMDRVWKHDDEEVPGPYDRPEMVQTMRDMKTVELLFRMNCYLEPMWDTDGNSSRKHD